MTVEKTLLAQMEQDYPKPHLTSNTPVNPDVELSHIKRNQVVNMRQNPLLYISVSL